jgi:hypothetical protein
MNEKLAILQLVEAVETLKHAVRQHTYEWNRSKDLKQLDAQLTIVRKLLEDEG